MTGWVCAKCNFRFSAESPRDCPYCGKESLEKEQSAEALIEDVDAMLRG